MSKFGVVFFSLNAFALKHISLFKEEHSPWMAIRCICEAKHFAPLFSYR